VRRIFVVAFALVAAAPLWATRPAVAAQRPTSQELCLLLPDAPGRPAATIPAPQNQVGCHFSYFPVTGSDVPLFGMHVAITWMAGENLAKDYNDPTQYRVVFSCGAYLVSVEASPSKISIGRRTATELDELLRSKGFCRAVTRPAITIQGEFALGGGCTQDARGWECTVLVTSGQQIPNLRYTWSVDKSILSETTKTARIPVLAKGDYTVRVRATDPATNISSKVFEFSIYYR